MPSRSSCSSAAARYAHVRDACLGSVLTRFAHAQGNGKSLRAERAKAVFPDNWAADGGMSSARAGMNGGNSTMNGCNVLYDEMIGDLCDSEGSDRLECKLAHPN